MNSVVYETARAINELEYPRETTVVWEGQKCVKDIHLPWQETIQGQETIISNYSSV